MGKSGNTPAPPIQQTNSTLEEGFGATSAMLSQMMAQMNTAMTGYNQAMMSMQDTMRQSLIDDTPEIYKPPEVDWDAAKAELDARAKAQYDLDAAKRINFGTSVHSSPLLDYEEAETTNQSLIAMP